MSLIQFNFESQYLGNNHEISVILPDKPRGKSPAEFYLSGAKYKVLWLLHGTFGDHSDWIRKSNIELYACERDLIVVMPSGMNANYANWPDFGMGYQMYDYLFEELMPLIYGWFPASDKREDNFVAGLSMGGGGTLKYALGHPEKFGGFAVLSSFARDQSFLKPYADLTSAEFKERAAEILGSSDRMVSRTIGTICKYPTVGDYLASYENTWDRFKEVLDAGQMPKLYAACGEADGLYPGYLAFKEYCRQLGVDAKFEEIPGYKHEWRFWDITIQHAISYFGLDRPEDAGNPF